MRAAGHSFAPLEKGQEREVVRHPRMQAMRALPEKRSSGSGKDTSVLWTGGEQA